MAERRGQVAVKDLPPKLQKKLRRQKIMPKKARKLNRSMAGNALLFTLMFICGVFMALPLVMIINNALKPLDELYQFPPKIFVRNPNLRNFSDLFILMNDSWVPFSRYIMNTIIITVAGMVGHVIVASWAAYPLAKDKFPGKAMLFGMVVLSMMFNWTVTQIPQYAIISWLHINNTYLALILPAWSFGMGLYLMKQFMEQLPDSLMESARVQGANEWQIFWKIVMPNVKPAWLTLAIFQFQQMWGNTGSLFLRDEQLKPMQYALQQITAGGVSRAGAAASASSGTMNMDYLIDLFAQLALPDVVLDYIVGAVSRISDIIQASGVQIVLFIAGLQSIPSSLYEVAKIEGATGYETFWKVTFPMVMPHIITCTIYTIVDAFSKSEVVKLAYSTAFTESRYGLSSAFSVVSTLITCALLGAVVYFIGKRTFYYN